MKKMSKKIAIGTIIILLIIIVLIAIIGGIYYFKDSIIYNINLPELEILESISIEKNGNNNIITDRKGMQDILEVLKGNGRSTKQDSIQDSPVNANNVIKVDFNFRDIGNTTIFIYEKNNKHYIEQSYNGIYRISIEEYNSIDKYINQ